MENIVWFREVDKNDINLVGGKGANLGELTRLKIPIPDGFIVTSEAYFKSVKDSGAASRIKGILFGLDHQDPVNLEKRAKACRQEIENIEFPTDLAKKIESFYRKLGRGKDLYVAVRSSATAEDLPNASFAGQQTTFLNVRGVDALKEAVLASWASLFEARSIFYREEKKFDHFEVGIAIPIQKMVQSEVSGVMFTADPVSGDRNKTTIEAVFGLGELIVSGQATPDHYEIDKKNFQIVAKNIASQDKQLVKSKKGNKLIAVSKTFKKVQKLSDEKIVELAKMGEIIEKHYFFPQDIEWAYENKNLYIVQTRPITTLNQKSLPKAGRPLDENIKNQKSDYPLPSTTYQLLVTGSPASPIIATGKVTIIRSPKELYKVQKGDVLVAVMTSPDYVLAMKKAVAIVTDKGGRTSHAAIVSRELGIACVVGCLDATSKLKNGMIVTVDGAKGLVFKGKTIAGKNIDRTVQSEKKQLITKTATRLYVNTAEPDLAVQIAAKPVDGVGLLRSEFMLAQIGIHPKALLRENRKSELVEKLAHGLSTICKAFGKRPIIYRASDLKSNEYRGLVGGDKFEPKESNPMLGYRGAFRYIKDPDLFRLELEVIKKVREANSNLHLMIPFVRTVKELKNVKELVLESGLLKDKNFQLWMMAEIPSNAIMLEEFLGVGINGVSIGANDLTMLILGVDRDNEEVASEFYEMDRSVLWAIERIIKTCVKHKVSCSICGQAPSVYPELVEKLVNWGITSISVNPDRINETRQLIYQAEQKLITNS